MRRWRSARIAHSLLRTRHPKSVMPAEISQRATAPLRAGTPVRILVWNIQYAAGREQHFFYDGGEAVHASTEQVTETVRGITEFLRHADPDILLLQEVDRDSSRTGRLDELEALNRGLLYPAWASAPYYRVRYVPFPRATHLGRVNMHLSVFSRFSIRSATRHQLPLLEESWLRQQFNLRRCLLDVRIEVEGGRELAVINTHLSAFSRGDGTLPRQFRVVEEYLAQIEQENIPWILAGDFNSLPPGDDATRLGRAKALYPEGDTPLGKLMGLHRSVVPEEAYRNKPSSWRTYLPFGASEPDRTLDYAFVSNDLIVADPIVHRAASDLSDHLPLGFSIALR